VVAAHSVQAGVGDSAHFDVNDLLCVDEAASGWPRFRTPGVACSSGAPPERGLDFRSTVLAPSSPPRPPSAGACLTTSSA